MYKICLPLALMISLASGFAPESFSEDEKKDFLPGSSPRRKTISMLDVHGSFVGWFHLQELDHLAFSPQGDEQLQLLVHNQSLSQLKLDQAVQRRLITFLSLPPRSKSYDCTQFVVDFLRGTSENSGTFKDQDWSIEAFSSEALIGAGEVIGLSQSLIGATLHSLTHVAVKLADDLYISKAGMEADFLLISDLASMVRLWRALPTARLWLNS